MDTNIYPHSSHIPASFEAERAFFTLPHWWNDFYVTSTSLRAISHLMNPKDPNGKRMAKRMIGGGIKISIKIFKTLF
jgi:hypothetical protein